MHIDFVGKTTIVTGAAHGLAAPSAWRSRNAARTCGPATCWPTIWP